MLFDSRPQTEFKTFLLLLQPSSPSSTLSSFGEHKQHLPHIPPRIVFSSKKRQLTMSHVGESYQNFLSLALFFSTLSSFGEHKQHHPHIPPWTEFSSQKHHLKIVHGDEPCWSPFLERCPRLKQEQCWSEAAAGGWISPSSGLDLQLTRGGAVFLYIQCLTNITLGHWQ